MITDNKVESVTELKGTNTFNKELYDFLTAENYTGTNRCTVWNKDYYFEFEFNYGAWDSTMVRDINGSPHDDLVAGIGKYMRVDHGTNIDVPYRDYISGFTFWIADFDETTNEWSYSDGNIYYVPRVKTATAMAASSTGAQLDTLFDPYHAILTNTVAPYNPVVSTSIASMYFGLSYANEEHTKPNGIILTGSLQDENRDQVLGMIVIHYGRKNWLSDSNKLKTAPIYSFVPALELHVETPNIEPEVGANE